VLNISKSNLIEGLGLLVEVLTFVDLINQINSEIFQSILKLFCEQVSSCNLDDFSSPYDPQSKPW
jgi:hypothetical protein